MQTIQEIIAELKQLGKPANMAGMKRFGVDTTPALVVSVPTLRTMAKK